jgi:hypothetical protein
MRLPQAEGRGVVACSDWFASPHPGYKDRDACQRRKHAAAETPPHKLYNSPFAINGLTCLWRGILLPRYISAIHRRTINIRNLPQCESKAQLDQ